MELRVVLVAGDEATARLVIISSKAGIDFRQLLDSEFLLNLYQSIQEAIRTKTNGDEQYILYLTILPEKNSSKVSKTTTYQLFHFRMVK